MYQNVKWVRLTPDRPGRGGQKSGIHTFQQEPINDVRNLNGAHVYQGAWRRTYDSTAYPLSQTQDAGFTNGCTAIHGYVYPSLTDPAALPSVTVLGHTLGAGAAHFWDFSHGTIRSLRPSTNYQAAVFNTINQRCYGGDGLAEATIMDDRTPAIHTQANQNLGILQPTQPMPQTTATINTVPVVNGLTPFGAAYVRAALTNAPWVNHPNPNHPLGTCLAGETITLYTLNPNNPAYTGSLPASQTLSANGVSSNVTPFAATGTISITTGTQLVTLSGATWPGTYQYAGLSINFNGYSFVIADHGTVGTTYDINGNAIALSNTQLLILGIYNGPTLTNVPYTITGCQVVIPAIRISSLGLNNSGTLGYSQNTTAPLVQVAVLVTRANGQYRALGNISVGPSITSGTQLHVVSDVIMQNAQNNVHSASSLFKATDVGLPIVIDKAAAGPSILSTTITQFINSGYIQTNALNSSGSNAVNVKAMWGSNIFSVSDASMDNNVTFTLTSASAPWTIGNVGDTIMVSGIGAAGATVITTITAFISATQVSLAVKNVSGGAVTNQQAFWQDALAGSTTGPTYAYAWYDPETGHMSNVSPLYQIPKPTVIGNFFDFTNLTPVFQIDPGYISYPDPTVDQIRFSHIVFFRTLSTGGSTLYPIGSLMPFVGKVTPGQASTRGSWNPGLLQGWQGLPNNYTAIYDPVAHTAFPTSPNYWFDFSSDSDLILAGGFQAPQYTNSKPIVTLRGGATQPGYPYAMAYWDRRLWLVNTQEPDKLCFSCDDAQCPLGVPEESFPATNFLRLPGVDGRVIGLRTVGDMLLVTTERWAYIIAGNNESNYRLMKVSSAMPGVGTYQMDEFPTYSGAEGEPTTLFYLGRDWKVYQWTVGGQVIPISAPIQDLLDSYKTNGSSYTVYVQTRIHCASAWGRRVLIIQPSTLYADSTLVYDIDNQTWNMEYLTDDHGINNNGQAIVPMTSVYGLQPPVNELFAISSQSNAQTVIRSWMRDDATTASQQFYLQTFPMNFDGKKTRKRIVAVNIHATGGTYQLGVSTNESAALLETNATFGAYPDPLDSIYASDAIPVDRIFPGTVQDSVVMAAQFYASTNSQPVVGYRFWFLVTRSDTVPSRVYALDIGYVDDETPGEGDV